MSWWNTFSALLMHRGFYRRDADDDKDFGGRRPPLQIAADTAAATEDVSSWQPKPTGGTAVLPSSCHRV